MMAVVCLIFSFLLLAWVTAVRKPYMRTSFHLMIYSFSCLAIHTGISWGVIPNDLQAPGQFGAAISDPTMGYLVFTSMVLMCFAADSLSSVGSASIRFSNDELGGIYQSSRDAITFGFSLIALATLLHLVSRDFSVVLDNSKYLAASGRAGSNQEIFFAGIMQSISAPLSYAAFIALGLAISLRNKVLTSIVIFPCLWMLMFFVGANSRTAAVDLVFLSVILAVVGRMRLAALIVFSAAIYVFCACLLGRGTPYQGVLNIASILSLPWLRSTDWVGVVLNAMQGAIIVPDGFLVSGQHSEKYKILSMSPFPSFIDGFDQIRRQSEIRLHLYVPMSGITEVIRFGPIYWISAIAIYIWVVVTINSSLALSELGKLYVISVNAFVTLFSVLMFAYPFRTSARFIEYAAAFTLLTIYFKIFLRPQSKLMRKPLGTTGGAK